MILDLTVGTSANGGRAAPPNVTKPMGRAPDATMVGGHVHRERRVRPVFWVISGAWILPIGLTMAYSALAADLRTGGKLKLEVPRPGVVGGLFGAIVGVVVSLG